MSKKISKKKKDTIVKLYVDTNLPLIEIENIVDISCFSIYNVLKERGIPTRTNRKGRDNIDLAVSMYEQGHHIEHICEEANLTPFILYKELDERKIPRRYFTKPRKRTPIMEHPSYNSFVEQYNMGKDKVTISRELSLPYPTIRKMFKGAMDNGDLATRECDLVTKYEKEMLCHIAWLYLQYKNGNEVSIREVAKHMGVNENRIYNAIAKLKKEL